MRELLVTLGDFRDPHAASQVAGPRCRYPLEGIERPGSSLRGHLHLVDGSVVVEVDRFDTGFAHLNTAVGGTMVEDIPLSVERCQTTVVVPYIRVAAEVVDDDAFILVRAFQPPRHSVAQAGGHAPTTDVGEDQIVEVASFEHLNALVEVVPCFGDDAVAQGLGVYLPHTWLQPGHLRSKLSPEEVGLSVVIDEGCRVYLCGMSDGRTLPERSCGRRRHGHAFHIVPSAHTII